MGPLDRIDFKILSILQKNAQTPGKVIAAEVGLAASSCHERLKRLENFGVIRGSHIDVDLRSYGVGLQAILMLKISKHDRNVVDRFMREIALVNEVRSVFLISGKYDVIAHVVVKDTNHLLDLAFEQFTSRDEVVQIETSVIYEAHHSFDLKPLGVYE